MLFFPCWISSYCFLYFSISSRKERTFSGVSLHPPESEPTRKPCTSSLSFWLASSADLMRTHCLARSVSDIDLLKASEYWDLRTAYLSSNTFNWLLRVEWKSEGFITFCLDRINAEQRYVIAKPRRHDPWR